jgi:hypothetical protein
VSVCRRVDVLCLLRERGREGGRWGRRETSLRLIKTLRSMPRAAATRFLSSLTPSVGSASLMLAIADCALIVRVGSSVSINSIRKHTRMEDNIYILMSALEQRYFEMELQYDIIICLLKILRYFAEGI